MSKRQQRIAEARARPEGETAALREAERAPVARSRFRKFEISWDKRTLAELKRKEDK